MKQGIVFRQKVELGGEYEDGIEAVKGLQAGDTIVSKGIHFVHPDMKADIVKVSND